MAQPSRNQFGALASHRILTRVFRSRFELRFQDDVWRWNADRITADFDEFQRELIVENTRVGLAATRMRGRSGGRALVLDKEGIRVAEAMSSITSGSGGRSSNDISRRIGSGNFEIRPEQRLQTVSFYIPLSKRTLEFLGRRSDASSHAASARGKPAVVEENHVLGC